MSLNNLNILFFIGILQSKISTVFKNKNNLKSENFIESIISNEEIYYLYEDNLLFDIDFTPKCDNLPDCDSNIIGIEIEKKELVKLSNMANKKQKHCEEADYVSSRLKDYLSNDKSNMKMEPNDTPKKTLTSIKENDIEDKSNLRNINHSRFVTKTSKEETKKEVLEIKELRKSFISIEIQGSENDKKFSKLDDGDLQQQFEKGFQDLNKNENMMINNILEANNISCSKQRGTVIHHYRVLSNGIY